MNVLQCLGTGTVAATKDTNSDEIFVYLPGKFAAAEGGISLDAQRIKSESVNSHGETVQTDMLATNGMVPATWKNIGEPNRISSPNVREGSQVAIYQIMGSSEYMWTTWGFGGEEMRLEAVVYGWNANPNLTKGAPFDIANFYTFIISTIDGQMTLRNSMANGEASILETTFNFMEGRVTIAGAQKSMLVLDDKNHSFTYANAEESILTVDKGNIMAVAKDGIMFQTDQSVSMSCKQLLVQAEQVMFNVAEATEITSPNTTHNGNLQVNGSIGSTGGIKSESTVQGMSGLMSGNVNMDSHQHTNGNNGGNTGGPIKNI